MAIHRKSQDRGFFDHGWLKTYHSFSFADYHDTRFMGFRSLQVINEDFIAPGQGFGMHGHRDMEIITYVISGELQHKDTLGHSTVIRPGEIQRMSAGKGIRHSEFNPSSTSPVHLLQIWILPESEGEEPSYAQQPIEVSEESLSLICSREGGAGSISLNQDVDIFAGHWSKANTATFFLRDGRNLWLQVISGDLSLIGFDLKAGDGLGLYNNSEEAEEQEIDLISSSGCHFLLFDLP